jgi:hypothetical protein
MAQSEPQNRETLNNSQPRSAFDMRHPSHFDLEKEMRLVKLAAGYALAELAMEQFFAAGHLRPEHGDESY